MGAWTDSIDDATGPMEVKGRSTVQRQLAASSIAAFLEQDCSQEIDVDTSSQLQIVQHGEVLHHACC